MAPRNRCPVVLVAAVAALITVPAAAAEPATTRVSVSTNGIQSTADTLDAVVSADGRFVAFMSGATNLVPGDSNSKEDIFVRDVRAGVTTRVSVPPGGGEANGDSEDPAISGDGRFVVFDSAATNLAAPDMNNVLDVFVHDRQTGQTTRLSVDPAGGEATGGGSVDPSISADGRFVAFTSAANNLLASGDSNAKLDVFVRDRLKGETTRVSISTAGAEGDNHSTAPSISADGRFVAFQSDATTLVSPDNPAVKDIFVHDRATKETRRVSTGMNGAVANGSSQSPAISADGGAVAFQSAASNLVPGDGGGKTDIFVARGGQIVRVSVGPRGVEADDQSQDPSISADGLSVAYDSGATNLVPGDSNTLDVFVFRNENTVRVSLGYDGHEANNGSFLPSISADGRSVAFGSAATNLVPGDDNGKSDAFLTVVESPPSRGFQLFPS